MGNSANCAALRELYRIDHHALVVALDQNAALAIGPLRLAMSRMVQNMLRLEQRLAELTPPQGERKMQG